MKASILAIVLIAATGAAAQSRPSTTNMSCAAANHLVMTSQGIVLGTGGDTYDRFVANFAQCERNQLDMPAFAPTADNPACMIGYRCINPPVESK